MKWVNNLEEKNNEIANALKSAIGRSLRKLSQSGISRNIGNKTGKVDIIIESNKSGEKKLVKALLHNRLVIIGIQKAYATEP